MVMLKVDFEVGTHTSNFATKPVIMEPLGGSSIMERWMASLVSRSLSRNPKDV